MILNNETESWWMEQMLDKANMATSYKAYWLMGIFDIITEESRSEISFDDVVNRMIVHAWFTVTRYRLSFGVQDRLSSLVLYLSESYAFLNELNRDRLLEALEGHEVITRDMSFVRQRKSLQQMVPFRLLTPFFREATRGVKDQKKNKLIADFSKTNSDTMYRVDKDKGMLYIRPQWMTYIIRNQALIKGWIQYKLVLYLQARNPNVPNIPLKLNPPNKRNLSVATKFWQHVSELEVVHDIYTGKPLNRVNYDQHGSLSMDHFIPWSFVSHDEFWNLCPTFKNINSQKCDGLPELDRYLDAFCDLHFQAIQKLKVGGFNKKIIEDYYTIGNEELIHMIGNKKLSVNKHVIETSMKKAIAPIHQIALNQGFRMWQG